MSPEQAQTFADSLLATADKLWDRIERVNRLPVIHPKDLLGQIAPLVGELQGTARAIEWYAKHDNKGAAK